MLVWVIYGNWSRKQKLREAGIADIDKMDGIQFENYLKELFILQGYSAKVTKASGDFGADLLLSKEGMNIAVQAKRYSKSVGIKAVQEVIASKEYYKVDKAYVVTNNYFSKAAIELASKSNVRLFDREQLITMILEVKKNKGVINKNIMKDEVTTPKPSFPNLCPKCNASLVKRKGKYGEFHGCSNYPSCRYTSA